MAGQPALLVAATLALAPSVVVPPDAGAPPDVALPVADAAMRDETGRLAAELGALRRIPLRGPLERQLMTRDEARAEIERTVTTALTGSGMATEERILQRLGLLPVGSDYAQLLAQALSASPTSSYDAGAHRLYVADWIPLEQQRTTLAHEIAHALADQRFGLRRTLQIGSDGVHRLEGDAERARQALIEGDANTTALELEDTRGAFLGARQLPGLADRLREAGAATARWPPWIRTVSLFAHVDGLMFVARVRGRDSWSGFDAVWADPPQSTEQILHPEKYDAHEPPIRIAPAPLGALEPGLRLGAGTVLGELGVRAWLETAVAPEVAARAAAGWGGDRAVLLVPPPADPVADAAAALDPALAWLTVWDDPLEAEDFARTACVALAKSAGGRRVPALDDAGRFVARAGDREFALAWQRDAVAVLLGVPGGAAGALSEMLEGWQRAPAATGGAKDARRARAARPR
jgi:hypothetical protein